MVVSNDPAKQTYKVPAVEQAIQVMLCLADNGSNPKSLTDICQEVCIHRSKAFSILNTLNEYGFVKKYPNRKGYILGPGLLTLTGKMLETLSLPRLAEPILYELAKKVEATVTLGIISEDKTYTIAEYLGAPGIGVSSPIGYVTPITYGSHGKAIAAFLPEDKLEELLKNKELFFYGRPENFDKTKLLGELSECRRNGFALELGDIQQGMNAVAAPILNQNNYPIGYVTIVGFFTEKEAIKLGPLAVDAVKIISKEAGHMIFWQKNGNRRNFT
ncbi:MAG: IclR family transcriptional regulator [Dehalococcoidales bacterium]